jgi:hypothetical protein
MLNRHRRSVIDKLAMRKRLALVFPFSSLAFDASSCRAGGDLDHAYAAIPALLTGCVWSAADGGCSILHIPLLADAKEGACD